MVSHILFPFKKNNSNLLGLGSKFERKNWKIEVILTHYVKFGLQNFYCLDLKCSEQKEEVHKK